MTRAEHPITLSLTALLLVLVPGVTLGAAPAKIELTVVDDQATGYATFQSHNQKVLANEHGIFMTHIRSRNEAYTAQQWRLSRSTDGGRTFTTVHEAAHATNPPVIETDEEGNIHLVRPDFLDSNSYLYRFSPDDDFREPRVTPIPGSAAGKFALAYDGPRKRMYYASQNHTFHAVGLDGTVQRSLPLLVQGPNALMQYPLLHLDDGGTLHYAWTTSKHGVYLYWDIHAMRSPDGGESWHTLAGDKPLPAAPIVCDDTGPTDRVSLDDEFDVHTWLSSFLVRGGKAHFVYGAQFSPAWRMHYMRYDLASGKRDVDLSPRFAGEQIDLLGLDGFFAASTATLFYTGRTTDGRVGCLASDDNGQTWRDHAVTGEPMSGLYAIGGCRTVTPDGFVIGSFTSTGASPAESVSTSKVYFLRIPAAAR